MSATLEQRIAALEEELARLQRRELAGPQSRAWLGDLYGKFAGDAVFQQAMKLGQKYRKSLRPRVRKAKPKQ